MKNLLSVNDLTYKDLDFIFPKAENWKNQGWPSSHIANPGHQRILVNLFFEPSTRTSSSFEAAAYRIGHKVISIKDVASTSLKKGESFEDTIRAYSSYGDALVLRHPDQGASLRASKVSSVPVINAGDGTNEHPTQALLDLFTIQDRLTDRISFSNKGKQLGFTDLTITFCGDLKYGRTVHSLAKLMARFEGVKINYVACPDFQIENSFMADLNLDAQEKHLPKEVKWNPKKGDLFEERQWEQALTPEILEKTDVLYMTRVQKERISSNRVETSNIYGPPPVIIPDFKPDPSVLTPELVPSLPEKSIIMHPFPRVGEIDPAIDGDPRVAYFDQMKNGAFVRAALLSRIST